jgi:hypothetical protein
VIIATKFLKILKSEQADYRPEIPTFKVDWIFLTDYLAKKDSLPISLPS